MNAEERNAELDRISDGIRRAERERMVVLLMGAQLLRNRAKDGDDDARAWLGMSGAADDAVRVACIDAGESLHQMGAC